MRLQHVTGRSGLAIMMLVVVLAIVTLLITTTTWQFLAGRRALVRQEFKEQAHWLARAGQECAINKLLENGNSFQVETGDLLPDSLVRMEATFNNETGTYHVKVEALYPVSQAPSMRVTLDYRHRRIVEGTQVRLERLP